MGSETEEYLLNKLNEAVEKSEGTEDCLPKLLFNIKTHFQNLYSLLREPTICDASGVGESSRKEKLHFLLNAHAEWQMMLQRKSIYSPEGLHFAGTLKSKLKTMERELDGKSKTSTGGSAQKSHQISDGQTDKTPYCRWSSRTIDRNRVYGFSEKENFMMRFLIRRDNEMNGFKAIGIFGVAGVGKTTLCQLTFNNEKVVENFFPRIWVCLSKQPEDVEDYREEVLRRMLKCLGVDHELIEHTGKNRGLRGLLFALHSVLKGRRYLVVLDDAFYSNDFFDNLCSESKLDDNSPEKLAFGFPRKQGGKVIVTSRSMELAKRMVGEENVHPLLPLNLLSLKDKRSCLEIFRDAAGEEVMKLVKDETADTIMTKSGGLPWAAKMMGQIMKEEQLAKSPAANTTPLN